MADNANTGQSNIVAADEIGGVMFQRVKVAIGADGENDGDISSAHPMPISGTVEVSNLPEEQSVSVKSLPLPTGAATSANQDTLESLIETLQELVARLAVLTSWASSGAPGMRVVGVSMPSTAVTGPLTSAQLVAENNRINNVSVVLGNINNCTGA